MAYVDHAQADVESLMEEVEVLRAEVETMVHKDDVEEAEREAAEARADVEAYETGMRRVFAAMATDPRVTDVLLAGQEDVTTVEEADAGDAARLEERLAVLMVVTAVVPLFELIRKTGEAVKRTEAEAERRRRWRIEERARIAKGHMTRSTREQLATVIVHENGLPPLTEAQRGMKTGELVASRAAQAAELIVAWAKLSKSELAEEVALRRVPEPEEATK